MINRSLRFLVKRFDQASKNRYRRLWFFEGGFMVSAKLGSGSTKSAPAGWIITWINTNRMRKTVACSVKTIAKSGWSAQITAWQAWCRVAVPAGSGMIRINANLLKNQPSAIDACIILKLSTVTATARRPRESSDVPLIPKRISASALYRFAKSWISALKNPRAALTLPGGNLIVAIVKHDQNPNLTRLTMPRRHPLWPMWAKPLGDLPCLPSNDYYQWPATIIFVLLYFYHNILINVKKKYYMLYIHALISH